MQLLEQVEAFRRGAERWDGPLRLALMRGVYAGRDERDGQPVEETVGMMERFAAEVMPHLRGAPA